MKKVISMILATAMIVTITSVMTSCGNDEESSKETTSQVTGETSKTDTESTSSSNSVFPEALENVEALQLPDIVYTGWQLSGGMIDGKEMEEDDLNSVLEACGGIFQFIFLEEGQAIMENGENRFEGTYEAVENNYAIHVVFEGYEYYAVFTEIEDETVMILANKLEPETALYLTIIEG